MAGDGSFLGYVPKSINRDLSRVLRFGTSAELRGARFDEDSDSKEAWFAIMPKGVRDC